MFVSSGNLGSPAGVLHLNNKRIKGGLKPKLQPVLLEPKRELSEQVSSQPQQGGGRERRKSHALWVKPVEVSSVVGKQPFGRGLQRTSKAYGDLDEKRTPICWHV